MQLSLAQLQPTQKLNWEQVDEIVKYLGHNIREYVSTLHERNIEPHIISIARGGNIPATKLSHMLDIPMHHTIHARSYTKRTQTPVVLNHVPELSADEVAGAIFVEDIVDTGETITALTNYFHDPAIVSLVAKPEGFEAHKDRFIFRPPLMVTNDIWVSFPWEREFKI